MGCNCKTDNSSNEIVKNDVLSKSTGRIENKFVLTTLKVIVFLLSMVLFVIIIPYIFWVLFRAIVLSKDFNLVKSLEKIIPAKKSKKKYDYDEDDDEDEEYDDDDDEDYDYQNEFGEHYDDLESDGKIIEAEVIETVKN